MLTDLIKATRSVRRFRENAPVGRDALLEIVDVARLTASGSNKQPIKYRLSHTPETNAIIFPHLRWAGYLADWPGPAEGERPAAYIILLGDTSISQEFGVDHGIAAQTIMLAAREKGLGSCILGSVQRDELRVALGIPAHLKILLVVALGVQNEEIVLETVGRDGDIKYYRDANEVHHVPKRSLDEVVVT